jgi:hypothetical protein
MVLLSAQGVDEGTIAKIALFDDDRVRDVIPKPSNPDQIGTKDRTSTSRPRHPVINKRHWLAGDVTPSPLEAARAGFPALRDPRRLPQECILQGGPHAGSAK